MSIYFGRKWGGGMNFDDGGRRRKEGESGYEEVGGRKLIWKNWKFFVLFFFSSVTELSQNDLIVFVFVSIFSFSAFSSLVEMNNLKKFQYWTIFVRLQRFAAHFFPNTHRHLLRNFFLVAFWLTIRWFGFSVYFFFCLLTILILLK